MTSQVLISKVAERMRFEIQTREKHVSGFSTVLETHLCTCFETAGGSGVFDKRFYESERQQTSNHV